jgi:hydroxymethylpyrimidine/phosphomethylpyrimidine kinase
MSAGPSRACVLSIAGSDPSAGSGAQADLKTLSALGVYGLSVITLVTAQDSDRVYAWVAVEPRLVRAQIEAAAGQCVLNAVKLGALGNAAVVEVVARTLGERALGPIVLDPVLISSSGMRLIEPAGETIMRERLLPLTAIITPNLAEAALLSGVPASDVAGMRRAARALYEMGPRAIVIKGGHLGADQPALDLFFDGKAFHELSASRQAGLDPHGTGCAFSAAIAAYLARGAQALEAVQQAKRYISRAIAYSFSLGGRRPMLDHERAGRARG